MQPTSSQTQQAVPRQRVRSFGGPYPGPYAYPYPGPSRPYPELPEDRGGTAGLSGRMPRTALVAGVLAVLGVFPLAVVSVAVLVLGRGVTSVHWWDYGVPVAAVLELAGAIWLLGRRGWLLPALSFVPASLVFLALLGLRLLHHGDLGLGWYVAGLCLPVVALVLTLMPSARRWIRTRPGARAAR